MKNVLCTALFVIPLLFIISCAGTVPQQELSPNQRSVEYIIDYKHKQDVAFNKVSEWLAANYKDASKVIQLKDKENGLFVINARVKISVALIDRYYPYILKIRVKDIKSKLIFETGTSDDSDAPYYYGKYPPPDNMPDVLREYEMIKISIEHALTTASSLDDF